MSECSVQRLGVEYAAAYRELMLEAYECHPDAFMSSTGERAALPLSWWQKRLDDNPRRRKWCLVRWMNRGACAAWRD